MCSIGGGGGQASGVRFKDPRAPTPEQERLKLEAEATKKANEEKLGIARRKRKQAGLLLTEQSGGNVLSSGAPVSKSNNPLQNGGSY